MSQWGSRNQGHPPPPPVCFPARQAGGIQQLVRCWGSRPGNSEPRLDFPSLPYVEEDGKCCPLPGMMRGHSWHTQASSPGTSAVSIQSLVSPCLTPWMYVKHMSWGVCQFSTAGLSHPFLICLFLEKIENLISSVVTRYGLFSILACHQL